MNKDLEQLKKSARMSAAISIAGVVIAISSLAYLYFQSQYLKESSNELTQVVEAQKNANESLVNEIKGSNTIPIEPQMTIERVERSRRFYDRNDHCSKSNKLSWRVAATEGWEIDVSSISPHVDTQSSNSHFIGISSVSPQGFSLDALIRNNGECIKAFGSTISKDARGSIGVTVKYVEYREVPANS